MQQKEFRYKLLFSSIDDENSQVKTQYMAALKSSSDIINLAWSGDICLEGKYLAVSNIHCEKFPLYSNKYIGRNSYLCLIFPSCISHQVLSVCAVAFINSFL